MLITRTRLAAAATVALAAGAFTLLPGIATAAGPSISVDVTATVHQDDDPDFTGVGDTISYTFTITNTGDADVRNAAVVADLLEKNGIAVTCPEVPAEGGWLVPGATLVCVSESEYTIAEDDITYVEAPEGSEGPGVDTPEEPSEEPTDEPSEEPTDGASRVAADEPSDEPTDDPSDEPTDEPSDDPTDDGGELGEPPVDPNAGLVPVIVLDATATAGPDDADPVTATGRVIVYLDYILVGAPIAQDGGAEVAATGR